jgi:acyl carrier protein
MYKTGDLVRYRGEGKLEFLGRLDYQVKIRGFRIELGEIESVLLRHPNIKEAVVSARGATDGEKRLVAYVVSRQQPPPNAAELKTLVSGQLPEYMTPAAFMVLDALPLTPNGKVDRKALPEPEVQPVAEDFVPPTSPAEIAVAKLWCEVLGVKQVSLQDNFFSLGGHSLMATQLISRFEKFHKVTVKLRDVFESPTLGEMSQMLERKQAKSSTPPTPVLAAV